MGIEPMTNGLLDQRSTDWAMRPFLFSKNNKKKRDVLELNQRPIGLQPIALPLS